VESPEPPVPLRSDMVGTAAWVADAALGAVNGAVGDHLHARGSALDLGMALRRGDRYVTDDADVSGLVVVLVHGLGTTEWCWALDAEAWHGDPAATFGTMLERDIRGSPRCTAATTPAGGWWTTGGPCPRRSSARSPGGR
jgi:hypothetical protein